MTYCDKSVLAPTCGSTGCNECFRTPYSIDSNVPVARELKFRAWNIRFGKWTNDFSWSDESTSEYNKAVGTLSPYGDDVCIMQYTGLKDKNGFEIYEGDIVNSKLLTHPVEVKIQKYHISPFHNEGGYPNESEKLEVIGNIYENHELINNK